MKILILDDEQAVAEVLALGLKRRNIEAVIAHNAQQAMEVLTNEEIDVLVTDLVMPDIKGTDLVRKLRQDARFRNLPVLIISGRADRQDVIQATELDIQGFIAKPFSPDDLRRRILSIFKERRQALRERQIQEIWQNRQTSFNEIVTPQVVFGEPLSRLEDLWHPDNRSLVTYLSNAREAIAELNDAHDQLDFGYVLEDNTADIIIPLVRHAAKKWIKLIMLSTRCPGKPILLVRLFAINRRTDMPIFLIYDHRDDLTPEERSGLKNLGVKLLKRGSLDKERLVRLFNRHVVGKARRQAKVPAPRPLSPDELRARIIEDLESMKILPSLPQVYERILTLAKDPDSDLKEWIRTIRLDPMTCAVILRHANTLSYGFKGRIVDVDRAVVLLGKQTVVGLVASEATRQTFTAVQEQGFDLEDFWLHNLAVGFAAHILSLPVTGEQVFTAQEVNLAVLELGDDDLKLLRKIDLPGRLKIDYTRENPFVGGIMHDLGKGVMVQSYPGLFPMIIAQLKEWEWNVSMSVAEEVFAGGLTHPIVGEILARNWGLDPEVCEVILHHHFPGVDQPFPFLIGIADIIGQALYPFPRGARYPVAQALEEGSLISVAHFLPEGFLDNPLLSTDEFTTLARLIIPRVRLYTEKMRQSMRL